MQKKDHRKKVRPHEKSVRKVKKSTVTEISKTSAKNNANNSKIVQKSYITHPATATKPQPLWTKFCMGFLLVSMALFSCIVLFFSVLYFVYEPSHERNWKPDLAREPYAEFNGSMVTIYNIRNQTYTQNGPESLAWYNDTFDLSKISKMWFLLEQFAPWAGGAHTFFSFEFNDGKKITLSVEARFETHEEYDPIVGIFEQYEIVYIITPETDNIKRRTLWLHQNVYMYPINASQQKIRALFEDVLVYANQLKKQPEYYHTLTNTCTTNLAKHADRVSPGRLGFTISRQLPGYSDEFLFKAGLLNITTLNRSEYNITDAGRLLDGDFSENIRTAIKE